MGLETGRISGLQFMLLMTGFTLGSSLVLTPGGTAAHDSWIAILLGIVEGSLFALVYSILSARFKNKTLIEINEVVFGPVGGKLISLLFLWYLFHLGSLVIGNFTDFFSTASMPRTPTAIFAVLIVLVCTWAVKHGIEVLARCSQILVVLAFGLFFMFVFLLLKNLNLENLQPVLEVPFKKLIWAAHGAATFPFGETVAFVMIIPFLKNSAKAPVLVVGAIILAGLLLTTGAIYNAAGLGAVAGLYTYPTFQVSRLINVGELLNRMEIIIMVAFLSMGFVKIGVLIYGTVLGSAQLLGLRTYRPLILPLGILMIILSLINFKSVTENIWIANQIYPIYAIPFEVIIPLLTLSVAILRRLPKPS